MFKVPTLRSGSLILLVLFLCGFLSPLRADQAPVPEVIYGHKAGMALTFDVLEPEGEANGCGVLFMVSGGWVSKWYPPAGLAKHQAISRLLKNGYKIFLVRHGSSPRFKVPEAVEDVRRAVRYIRHHAERYEVDPERLGVFGGSAGGHLSLMLGVASDQGKADAEDPIDRQSNRVAAVVAYFPPVELAPYMKSKILSKEFPALQFDLALAKSVSPLAHVTPDDAPSLLIHGEKDKLVTPDHSRRIHRAMKKERVVSKLIMFPEAAHGFGGRDERIATKALVNWFNRHLLQKKVKSKGDAPSPSVPSADDALALNAAALLGTWNLKISMNGETVDYGLRFAEKDGELGALLVSKRSGKHPFQTVEIKDDHLRMSIVRSLQKSEFTFLYEVQLQPDGDLVGTVKTGESTGTLSARKSSPRK